MQHKSFAVRHNADGWLWLVFLATSWLAITMGFLGPLHLRMKGMADYPAPAILIIHMIAYLGWMVLLTSQALLVSLRRFKLHQSFGFVGMPLAVFVTFTGISAEVFSQRFYAPSDPENVRFFMVPLVATIGFGVLALLAFLRRRDPPAHKRLMLLATAAVVQGAYGRWWGDAIEAAVGARTYLGTFAHWFTGQDLILLATVAYDLATRGRVHPVNRYGVPFLIAMQIVAIAVWHSDWWPPLGRSLMGLSGPN
jgi:uncharacterized membrane protein YozB (DUF420 family)